MKDNNKKMLTLKTLSKSNVWDVQENDIFRMLATAEKDSDIKDNIRHYLDVIKTAFEIEEIKTDRPEIIKKYESRGFKVGDVKFDENSGMKLAIKKRPISRVTDLTYENIRHISAAKLMEVIDRNFGGGWDALSQSIQDIIESGFDISTTTLPKDRLHKKGGMYEKKVADGFSVLEIPKGLWIEAIFAKAKPETEKPHTSLENEEKDPYKEEQNEEELPDEDVDEYDEEDDSFDDDKLTEESYRTTIEENPDDFDLTAENVADEDEY